MGRKPGGFPLSRGALQSQSRALPQAEQMNFDCFCCSTITGGLRWSGSLLMGFSPSFLTAMEAAANSPLV
jgi:hypothetical protein